MPLEKFIFSQQYTIFYFRQWKMETNSFTINKWKFEWYQLDGGYW